MNATFSGKLVKNDQIKTGNRTKIKMYKLLFIILQKSIYGIAVIGPYFENHPSIILK